MGTPGSPHRPRVLVVDDEPENVALLTRILQRTYDVDAANSGEEALEKLTGVTYDIIITDQRMPGITGAQFLAKSARLAPNAIRIVVSAYSDFEATLEALNVAGASAFLRKPISSDQLESAISKAVKTRSDIIRTSDVVSSLEIELRQARQRISELEARVAGTSSSDDGGES